MAIGFNCGLMISFTSKKLATVYLNNVKKLRIICLLHTECVNLQPILKIW